VAGAFAPYLMSKVFEPKEYLIQTGKEGCYNITHFVNEAVSQCEIDEGMVFIYCPHTTAGVTITENTDPHVTSDMLMGMTRAFPDHADYKHFEGNSFAHVKSSMMGCQMFLFITGGWPLLGPWQAIYFCEFDGPRERRFYVKVVEC